MLPAARRPDLLLVLLLAALLPLGRAQKQAEGGWLTGTLGELGFGTTYAPEQGACGYGPLPPSQWPFGGLAAVDPLASPFAVGVQQGYGVCLEIQCADPTACGTSQSLVVQVTDHCDGCGATAVYLAPSAFGDLVPGPLGSVAGRFRRVNCNPPGPLSVVVDQYRTTGGSWLRLALKNVAGGGDIVSVSLAPSSTPDAWTAMQHSFGAAWEASNPPSAPLDLLATDSSGQQVVARRVLQQAGEAGTFLTDAQFQATQGLAPAPGSIATIPAAPTPPPSPPMVTFESLFGLTAGPPPAAAAAPAPAEPVEATPTAPEATGAVPAEGEASPPPEVAPVEQAEMPAPVETIPTPALAPAPEAEAAPAEPAETQAAPILEPAPVPSPEVQQPEAAVSPVPPPQPEAAASPVLPPQPEAAASPVPPPQPESPAPVSAVPVAAPQPEQQQPQQPLTVQLVTAQPAVSPSPLAAAAPIPEAVVPPVGAPAISPAFALPPPAPAAPEIVDTRPPRPPGVGPSISPAPVVYSPETGLPTVRALPATSGPASPSRLVGPGFNATCSTIGEVLARIPEASNWTQLVTSAGLSILLQSKSAQVTLLVPLNSALSAEIDARPLRAERNLSELVLNAPEIVNPLVGYHVLPRLWPSSSLLPGTAIDTSDTIDKVNRLQITAQGPTALQGIGSSARILQGDLAACGPSVIHVIDQVLLPFTFNQSAIDAITGTQVPLSQANTTLPAAGRR